MALVAATPVVYTEQASLWGQNVFPNDLSWRLHHKVKKIEHEKNNNDLDTKNNKVCETKDCFQVCKYYNYLLNLLFFIKDIRKKRFLIKIIF